jgi:hypothetical protein
MSHLPTPLHGCQLMLLAALVAIAAPVVAHEEHDHDHEHEHREHGAHVHGVAELNVAVDGDSLLLELNTPAMNIVGFEHPPRTDEQRAAIDAARAQLADGAALFVPNAAAECAQSSQLVTLDLGDPEDHDHAKDAEVHSDAHGEWTFTCAKPTALEQLDVQLFEVFPGKEKLRVQLITPSGQRGDALTPEDHVLDL